MLTTQCDLSITEIAFKLGGAKKIPNGFLCRCPGHDDRKSSLSLSENAKGALLVSCHAGCSQDDVIESLKSLDLWRSGAASGTGRPAKAAEPVQRGVCINPVPSNAPPPPARHTNYGKPSSIWTYRDARSATCFLIYRFDFSDGTKSFSPLSYWREDGKEKWRWCMPSGGDRPLYNLCQLADRPNAVVIIAEGEKCADACSRIFPHEVCVTSSGGAAAARKTDWTPLRGRDCIIWPDLNEAGAKYMADIAAILDQPVDYIDAAMLARIVPLTGWQGAIL